MKNAKKIIRIADKTVNWLIVLCFMPLLLYGLYGLWDSKQINQQADASLYETYKPNSKDFISFAELQKKNPEVIGWITVDGTQIDYPLVQGEDNSKYVNTDPLGAFSLSGSIFLDCNNQKDFSDMNSIIYGHHMEKDAMFGEVEYYQEPSYFKKHAHVRQNASYFEELSFQKSERFVTLSTCTSDSTNGRHLLVGRIQEEIQKEQGDLQYEKK